MTNQAIPFVDCCQFQEIGLPIFAGVLPETGNNIPQLLRPEYYTLKISHREKHVVRLLRI